MLRILTRSIKIKDISTIDRKILNIVQGHLQVNLYLSQIFSLSVLILIFSILGEKY